MQERPTIIEKLQGNQLVCIQLWSRDERQGNGEEQQQGLMDTISTATEMDNNLFYSCQETAVKQYMLLRHQAQQWQNLHRTFD